MRFLPATPNPFVWVILTVSATLAAVTGSWLGFSAPLNTILIAAAFVGALLAVSAFCHSVLRLPAASEPASICAFWAAMGSILAPSSYIAAAFNMPFTDMHLVAVDQVIGFDWRWLHSAINSNAWSAWLAFVIYRYSIIQVLFALTVLAARRDILRLNTFISGLLVATVLMIVLSGLMPAIGAYVHYGITSAEMGYLLEHINSVSYVKDLTDLRSGNLRTFPDAFDGIVQFPSYHSIVALTAGWATLKVRWIGPLNAICTALVLVVTLPVGGHHLTDIIGAIAVTAVSLKAAGYVEGRRLASATGNTPIQVTEDASDIIVWTRAGHPAIVALSRLGTVLSGHLRGATRLTQRFN